MSGTALLVRVSSPSASAETSSYTISSKPDSCSSLHDELGDLSEYGYFKVSQSRREAASSHREARSSWRHRSSVAYLACENERMLCAYIRLLMLPFSSPAVGVLRRSSWKYCCISTLLFRRRVPRGWLCATAGLGCTKQLDRFLVGKRAKGTFFEGRRWGRRSVRRRRGSRRSWRAL